MAAHEPTDVLAPLAESGFAWLRRPHGDAEFVALARDLGQIVDDTPVRLVPGKRTYLARPAPIPLHTDHPTADIILWRCESQDGRDGASLLVDGRKVIEDLNEPQCAGLERLVLPAMVRLGDEPLPTPILARDGGDGCLFYAPWLEPLGRPVEAHDALVAFRRALSGHEREAVRVRLEPGHILVVDNHRMLHGRGRLSPESARRLRRLWVHSGSKRETAP